MNNARTILITKRTADEASYKLDNMIDNPDADFSIVSKEEVALAAATLAQGGGQYTFSRECWLLIVEELRNSDMDAQAERIEDLATNGPRPVVARPERAPMHAGNVATKLFKNTSRFSDDLVRRFIDFILEGGRLPKGCKVVLEQSLSGWGSGRGWGAVKFRNYHGGRGSAHGGKVYLCAPAPDVDFAVAKMRAHKGYLAREYYGAEERLFAVLAHEIRHVFQGFKPIYRECRKVRKHQLGTSGKLCEVDACLFETRALRRFRREFVRPSPSILPLP